MADAPGRNVRLKRKGQRQVSEFTQVIKPTIGEAIGLGHKIGTIWNHDNIHRYRSPASLTIMIVSHVAAQLFQLSQFSQIVSAHNIFLTWCVFPLLTIREKVLKIENR